MPPKPPSHRQLRVGEEIRHILAGILLRGESGDPVIDHASITLTEVRISPDLHHATVYLMPLGGKQIPEILSAFKDRAWYFRKIVAQNLRTRVAPRLVFQFDASFDEAQRIEDLLKSPNVKRDID